MNAALLWSSTVTILDLCHFHLNVKHVNGTRYGTRFIVSSRRQIMCIIAVLGPSPPCWCEPEGRCDTAGAQRPPRHLNNYDKRSGFAPPGTAVVLVILGVGIMEVDRTIWFLTTVGHELSSSGLNFCHKEIVLISCQRTSIIGLSVLLQVKWIPFNHRECHMRKQEEAMGKLGQDISTPSIMGSRSRVGQMHSLPAKNCKEAVPTWIHLCLQLGKDVSMYCM